MTKDSPLLQPFKAGAFKLANRVLMAPLTRGRASAEGVPNDLMVEYYRQRAEAGLIISEATAISPQGYGWHQAPGIWTDAHVEGWRKVTDTVHGAGGKMVLQLWHMGRLSHPDFQNGELPVSASALLPKGKAHTAEGGKPYVVPRALEADELPGIVQDYARAAKRALEAGFDGVEIHGANGYLLDQFLRDGMNQRTDAYGGSIENRARLLMEVVAAVCDAVGSDKTGLRLSPLNDNGGSSDSDPAAVFVKVAEMLNAFDLAYLHVLEFLTAQKLDDPARISPKMRQVFDGRFIVNGRYTQTLGEEVIRRGEADAIAYGVLYIANPDLVQRFHDGAPLNMPDQKTFYSSGPQGYIDYPMRRAG